jgi:hypothetical protein
MDYLYTSKVYKTVHSNSYNIYNNICLLHVRLEVSELFSTGRCFTRMYSSRERDNQ